MATDDQQVLVTGQEAAPATFTIPGNGQIQPKAVFSHYDGSAAATAFVPALKVVSDGGEVVAICPCHTQVAAGGSADVSWFPHVGDCDCEATKTDYTTTALALGPWAYYTLSDLGTGTFLDTSGHNRTCGYDVNHVAQGGPAILPNSTQPSAALTGPGGSSNTLAISSLADQLYTASVFTLTAWFQTSYAGANDQIIAGLGRLDPTATSLFALWLIGHVPVVRMYDATPTIHTLTGSIALNDGKTHMIAASYDGTTLTMYVDGVAIKSAVLSVALNTNHTDTVAIGMQLGGVSPRTFSGDISQVGYFDQVLTPAEIATLYNTGAATAAAVESVLAADSSITAGGTATNVTLGTASLDVIATAHPTAADWSNNSHKITSVADPTVAQDAATKAYVDSHAGTVSSVTATDTSIVIAGTAANPTVATGTLDVIAADHPPAADWSNNSHKITSVTDPTSAQDVATKHYVDGALPGAGALVLVASSLLSSPATSFDFTSLPQTYRVLRIMMQLRSDRAAGNFERVGVYFNNDNSAIYDWAFAGGAAASGIGGTMMQLADAPAGTSTAGEIGTYDLMMVNYSTTTFFKAIQGTAWISRSTGANNQFPYATGGNWRNTAAVNRITIVTATTPGGNWVTGSAVYIYGIT